MLGGSLSAVKRSLFRIHLITMLFAILTASLLLYGNVELAKYGDSLDPEINIEVQVRDGCRQLGWPLVACYTVTNEQGTSLGKFNVILACWDFAAAVAILTIVIIPVEWAERRRPWLRGHVSMGMVLVGCIVVLLLNEGNPWVFVGIVVAPIVAMLLVAGVFIARRTERSL